MKSDVILEGGPLLPMTRHRKNHKINHHVDPQRHGFLHDGRRRTRHNATTIPPRTANIMFDSRVCRGNTYANKQAMTVDQKIKQDMFKSNMKKSKRSSFQQTREKERRKRDSTPLPVVGRVHASSQTDLSIEELCLSMMINDSTATSCIYSCSDADTFFISSDSNNDKDEQECAMGKDEDMIDSKSHVTKQNQDEDENEHPVPEGMTHHHRHISEQQQIIEDDLQSDGQKHNRHQEQEESQEEEEQERCCLPSVCTNIAATAAAADSSEETEKTATDNQRWTENVIDEKVEKIAEMIVLDAKTKAIDSILMEDDRCYHSEDESNATSKRRKNDDVHLSHLHPISSPCHDYHRLNEWKDEFYRTKQGCFKNKDEEEKEQMDHEKLLGEGKQMKEMHTFVQLVILEATHNVIKNKMHSVNS